MLELVITDDFVVVGTSIECYAHIMYLDNRSNLVAIGDACYQRTSNNNHSRRCTL